MAMVTTGMSERAAAVNAPPWNLPDLADLVEGAFREEHQGLSGGGKLQHAPRIDAALVPVETLDELGPEAPQQQAGEGHAHHFLLDHEGKIGRQRRRGHQAIDVAGVVGHHHARYLRQPIQPVDGERNAGRAQKDPREQHRPPTGAAAGSARTD